MTKSVTVPLETPIQDGETTITSLSIRKPVAGELRGLSVSQLIAGDSDSHTKLIPRITSPLLTEDDIKTGKLDVTDFTAVVNEVVDFLLPLSMRGSLPGRSTN